MTHGTFTPSSSPRRKRVWIAAVTALVLSASACAGSAMTPEQVRAANAAVNGGSGVGGTDTGTGGGTGTGTGGTGTGAGGTGGTGTGAGGGAGSGAGTGSGGGTSTANTPPATAGVKAGSCAGFKNGPGITDSTITIGNSSDISGPVNGLFSAAQDGAKAYVAYFNATSNICGRKLALITQDSRTDAGSDQVAYSTLCSQAFAAVGSMSAFDSGGARTAQSCGLPDIRTASVTDERNACTTCFAAQGANPAYYENAPFTYFFKKDPSLKAHVAIAYLDAGGSAQNADTMQKVVTKLGATNVFMQSIDVSALSYGTYANNIKSKGAQYVIFLGPYQGTIKLQQALKQINYSPKVFIQDPTIYDSGYVSGAGSVGNGTYVYTNFLPFELAGSNKEMQAYLAWLRQVNPSAHPTFYGVWAWSAAALFVQQAVQLGGKLNRASLVSAVSKVNSWTTNGMTAPQNVGGKQNGSCWRIIQLKNGKWDTSLGGYQCDGVTHR